jgi:ubiquinone/menaquinone biosynthesis C-methylase UbiE
MNFDKIKYDRYEDEIRFFDKRSEERLENKKKFTLNNTKNYETLFSVITQLKPVVKFFGDINGKRILDLGCGEGWAPLYFARSGAFVNCCDISPKSIELAKKYVDANGLKDNIIAEVMNAEELKYKNDYFDYVFMNATLHHCDIEKVSTEIKRVLKPGGKAAIIEDNAYHPVINIYRYFTSNKRTKYEKPITKKDLEVFFRKFSSCEISYHKLFNIFDKDNIFTSILNSMDEAVADKFPKYLRYSRLVDIFVIK